MDSMKNLKASLENSLWEVEMPYAMQMELNGILLQLESKLAQTWAKGKCQVQEHKALLNIKVKLEAEITTYHCLLEEEDFHLGDGLDNSNSMQFMDCGQQSGI